jgi:hypothetical protein
MDSSAQAAARWAALQALSQTSTRSASNRANRRRAEDFIARASEFGARVHLSTAPKRIGADSVLLWFRTKPQRALTLLSLSGVIDAEIAAIGCDIAAYNARLHSSSTRS